MPDDRNEHPTEIPLESAWDSPLAAPIGRHCCKQHTSAALLGCLCLGLSFRNGEQQSETGGMGQSGVEAFVPIPVATEINCRQKGKRTQYELRAYLDFG